MAGTGAAVPSDQIADLKANAETLDQFVSSTGVSAITRTGKEIKTIHAIEQEADTLLSTKESEFDNAIQSTGWFVVGSFADGFTFTAYNQVGVDSNGSTWSYNGSLPFTVAAGTVPSEPDYTNRGDAAVRSAVAAADGFSLIGSNLGYTEDLTSLTAIPTDNLVAGDSLEVGEFGRFRWGGTAWVQLSPLESVSAKGVAVGELEMPASFPNPLAVSILSNGVKVKFNQDPFDLVDFTKNPDIGVAEYFVNFNTGSDANDGLTTGTAWKTITHAINNAVSPALINLEDEWIGTNNLTSNSLSVNGKFKFRSVHASGKTLITSMNENYTKSTYNWLDEGSGCWSTSAATTSATVFSRLGVACFDLNYPDELGGAMPLPQAASAAECIATPGTQFHDSANSKKYVHLLDGREPDPYDGFIYSLTRAGWNLTQNALSGGVVLLEGLHFYMNSGVAETAGCRYRHTTTDINDSVYGVKNCLSYGASGNGFEIYDSAVTVTSNSYSKYGGRDGFNYHSFKSTGGKGDYITVYEDSCESYYCGYDGFPNQPAVNNSCNGSTAHDSINIIRANGVFANTNGAVIADVNGCYSLNYFVKAGNPTGSASPKACFWHEKFLGVNANMEMHLIGCSAFDNGDSSVKLITTEPQSGANDGDVYVSYWLGQKDGLVNGGIKNKNGDVVVY